MEHIACHDEVHDVVVRDGSTLAIRPARPDEPPPLLAFFNAPSPLSLYYRFLGGMNVDEAAVARLIPPDARSGHALAAESRGAIVAFASYVVSESDPSRAEVAFAVADALQG